MLGIVGAVFVASLLGSAHCAGMCGAFVCFYAGADARASAWGHLAYNGGRLVSYLALGAIAGALGAGVEQVGTGVGVTRAAAMLAGLLMIIWGVITLLTLRGVSIPTPTPLAGAQRWMAARLRDVRDFPPVARALTVGLLTTLLPCGWLYAFVVTAAGTGSVREAMMVMAIFWAGTLPIMLALGVGVRRLAGPLRDRLPMVSALGLVVIGVLSLTGRVRMDPAKVAMHAKHMVPAALATPAASPDSAPAH
ncbi:MAG: sulfite exporter TauE/SafE family protein, partial [Gemmatimonadota bacterium]|nr:sulfite exporter TauE/SafE family protein [Gemmatimonadota bacterium]